MQRANSTLMEFKLVGILFFMPHTYRNYILQPCPRTYFILSVMGVLRLGAPLPALVSPFRK